MSGTYGKTADGFLYGLKRLLYLILGILQIPLAFKVFFELIGAPSDNSIISFVYRIADYILTPFNKVLPFLSNIRLSSGVKGISAHIFLDVSTILAMIVYFLVVWLVVKILATLLGRRSD